MDQIAQFFNDVIQFYQVGIPDMLTQFLAYLGKLAFYSMLTFKLYMTQIAYEIAQQVLSDFNVTALIESGFNSLDSKTMAITNYFRIPDFIKNVIGAYATRFVLSVMS